ncbi:unnamed protein product [Dibothriocephalus latus]|uniref:Uncharacterized protein n=1 Tax=Dibothriocephalus latus TaxID=60516 RepID=A0A3P7LB24_DIBLA|nr:unnamed protein product [Dibothriocephalus latus]
MKRETERSAEILLSEALLIFFVNIFSNRTFNGSLGLLIFQLHDIAHTSLFNFLHVVSSLLQRNHHPMWWKLYKRRFINNFPSKDDFDSKGYESIQNSSFPVTNSHNNAAGSEMIKDVSEETEKEEERVYSTESENQLDDDEERKGDTSSCIDQLKEEEEEEEEEKEEKMDGEGTNTLEYLPSKQSRREQQRVPIREVQVPIVDHVDTVETNTNTLDVDNKEAIVSSVKTKETIPNDKSVPTPTVKAPRVVVPGLTSTLIDSI